MDYAHTQKAPLHYALDAIAIGLFVAAWLARGEPVVAAILAVSGLVLVVFALAFRTLTVCDEGVCLSVRFGPLPLFGTRVPYSEITAVERGRSALIDGWGIHYIPGRGWTYNLWGFDCAVLYRGRKVLRVGSDDAEGLVGFLKERIAGRGEASGPS